MIARAIRIARVRDAAFGIAMSLASSAGLSGCLVTNKTTFEDSNSPPILLDLRPASFTRAPSEDDPRCGQKRGMPFFVRVVDPDVEDQLFIRVIVNGETLAVVQQPVETTGVASRGEQTVCLRLSNFDDKCSHVEMLVSRGFGNELYDTRFTDDVGRAVWWVLGNATDTPQAVPADCVIPDGGLP